LIKLQFIKYAFAAVCISIIGSTVLPSAAFSQANYTEIRDAIPIRGTEYLIRFPENWNGTLISDLDYRRAADSPLYTRLLADGFALSGTNRRPERLTDYDPAHEIHDLVTVMDIFEENFGKPSRTIHYGCSGGANVTLGMAEIHPDRIDGAVAIGSVTSHWFTHQHLDGFFVLKALIAPDLPIVNLPIVDPEITQIGDAWREAIEQAQQTPEGRARIALAVTIGQWPAWANLGEETPVPEPDPNDADALQIAMYHGVSAVLPSNVTFGHSMLEQAAGLLRGNVGVDYRVFFDNGDVLYKQAVAELYEKAGLNLADELGRLNAFPRIEADPEATKYWSMPGRTHVGEPKVPLLRMHNNGDLLVYPSMLKGYQTLVDANGRSDLYRTAYTNRAGHCT
jgi:pimeloyl-ACP methyl ester carboxylesterase